MKIKDIAQYEDTDSELAKYTIITSQQEIERLNKELEQEKKDFKEANDKCFELISENKKLNNIIEKLEQENAVLKTLVVNKDKYTYGIR